MEFEDINKCGRKKIIINCSVNEFFDNPLECLKKNFSSALKTHRDNVEEMRKLISIYRGKQGILSKTRANGDSKINNKLLMNYAWEFVNFKKGYYIGSPIKYVDNKIETNESMKYLLKYVKDINKQSKDLTKYENLLVTGIAYTYIDYKKNNGNIIDTENYSPFDYYVLNNENTFMVYANDIMESLLFSCCISNVNNKEYYTLYYDYGVITFTNKDLYTLNVINIEKQARKNPITEYCLNKYRIGLFEPIINVMENLNIVRSNQIDQLEEAVNNYLLFKNVEYSEIKDDLPAMKSSRTIAVKSNNPDMPADVTSIIFSTDLSSSNSMYSDVEQRMYDIVGVPMPTSNTGQGVSGEAQVYGGGWENAQTIANVDTQYISQFEKQDLDKMLDISRNVVNSKTADLFSNDIEIKYTINKSNNMMTKSQSAKYFYDMKMPKELILEFCEISADAHTHANIWEEYESKAIQENIDLDVEKTKKINEIQKVNSTDNVVDE